MARIRWLGHAAFEITLGGRAILIDPWITGNPKCPIGLEDLKRVDLVLVTHDHPDHLGDAIEIARRTNATFVGIYELTAFASEQGVKDVVGMNIGGMGMARELKILLTPALHSAQRGSPVGFIVKGSEATIYHAGDTCFLCEMEVFSKLYGIDVALLPIGSYYTMDPIQAARASATIRPKVVIPMHYGTWPVVEQDPSAFEELVGREAPEVRVVILKPGEAYEF